ncbi:MAG TPA: hypothetical protein DCZ01_05595 [Elusimicrobia bacterium]|nr:MAG: hypothetical protein A2X37_11435 [Elusimicrobia bacterium GWA2_66_18]HAZ07995.1 hypothetical protein [Elusimicrobiota bacterium]
MLKNSIVSFVSAAFLVAGPSHLTPEAAAQIISRGPVTGTSVTSAIGTGLNSSVPSALSPIMPASSQGALSAPTLLPVKGLPLAVIQSQDSSVGVAEKATALGIMFDDSVRTGAETFGQPAQPVYQHSERIPQKASSGRFWTMEMLEGFVKEHGETLRNVPGVRDVVVGQNEALGGKLASLTIIVDSSKDIAEVKKAIEKAVPDIKRVYGVLGAPNQAVYQHSA